MKAKNFFRLLGAYRALACGFGIFHEVCLNPNFYQVINGDYPLLAVVAVYAMVISISAFLFLGLIDGLFDLLFGTLFYLPLNAWQRLSRRLNRQKSISRFIFETITFGEE